MSIFSWLFSDPLPAGAPAPDFTLPDQDGKAVTLSTLRGKNVVLVFYPGDETSVCRKQLCEFRDRWPDVERKNTIVFGVNHASAKSHAAFRARRNFPFPLLVDRGKKIAALYNAGGPIVKRTVYLIDPGGVIRFAQRGKPAPEEALAAAV
ncbi:MAG: peroxiredoxin [Bryobacteraceae bacterium]